MHPLHRQHFLSRLTTLSMVYFGLLGVNASATTRVLSRRWNDDEISFQVEETGVPGVNHRPTASNLVDFKSMHYYIDVFCVE